MDIKRKLLSLYLDLAGVGSRDLALEWIKRMWRDELYRQIKWLGFELLQYPNDLIAMQELIFEQRPKVIIETGTHKGGSAIFYASMLELAGGGRVISVDLFKDEATHQAIAGHRFGPRITLVTGDSKAPETLAQIDAALAGEPRVLVALDSEHNYEHVLGELRAYQRFVPVGGYLVVFDTIVKYLAELKTFKGHDVSRWVKDNPHDAVHAFLRERPQFEIDHAREKMLASFCPDGFLRRTGPN